MNAHGASTKEYFEIVKFMEDSAPFTMLLGKPWIEKDQARKQEAEKDLEQQRQELRDFMTRRITQLIEERVIQVDIDGHPPLPTSSKQFSDNFGNLLF